MLLLFGLVILALLTLDSEIFFDGALFGGIKCKIGLHRMYRIIGGAPFSDLYEPIDHCRLCGRPKPFKLDCKSFVVKPECEVLDLTGKLRAPKK